MLLECGARNQRDGFEGNRHSRTGERQGAEGWRPTCWDTVWLRDSVGVTVRSPYQPPPPLCDQSQRKKDIVVQGYNSKPDRPIPSVSPGNKAAYKLPPWLLVSLGWARLSRRSPRRLSSHPLRRDRARQGDAGGSRPQLDVASCGVTCGLGQLLRGGRTVRDSPCPREMVSSVL